MVSFLTKLIPALGLIASVSAHARVFGISVNGVQQGEDGDGRSTYIRTPPNNSPVKDVTSKDIICNVANTPAPSSAAAAAGDKIDIEWYHDNRNDDIIDLSHKGPVIVYIAEASTNGEGAVWSKLAEEGLGADGKWAVENLVANGGIHSVTLPKELAGGDYLLRAEIIAHHESETNYEENPARGAQFYPACIQVEVTGSGSATPGGFDFIGGYTAADPGILFDLYAGATTYAIPGPAIGLNGDAAPAPEVPATTAPAATSSAAATTAPAATSSAAATSAPAVSTPVIATPAPISSTTAAVPTSAPVVPTTLATVTKATSTAAVPTAAPTTPGSYDKTPAGINRCLDAVNDCIRGVNTANTKGGAVDFSSCEAQRSACY